MVTFGYAYFFIQFRKFPHHYLDGKFQGFDGSQGKFSGNNCAGFLTVNDH